MFRKKMDDFIKEKGIFFSFLILNILEFFFFFLIYIHYVTFVVLELYWILSFNHSQSFFARRGAWSGRAADWWNHNRPFQPSLQRSMHRCVVINRGRVPGHTNTSYCDFNIKKKKDTHTTNFGDISLPWSSHTYTDQYSCGMGKHILCKSH